MIQNIITKDKEEHQKKVEKKEQMTNEKIRALDL